MSNTASVVRAPAQYFALLVGAGLLLLAALHAVSSFILLRPAGHLAVLTTQYQQAQAVFPQGETGAALAALKIAAAQRGQASWPEAQAALENALQLRPQDPLSWARLAYVYSHENRLDLLETALVRSLQTGPYMPGFMQWRFILSLRYWASFNHETRQLVAGQARMIWHGKPNDFIRLARMPALSSQIEQLVKEYLPLESAAFLQRRGRLRHTL